MLPSEYTNQYLLTAGETDAEGRMPLWLIVSRVIEVSTDHANALGLGYDTLIKQGIGWVLTRLSVEIIRYPRINENYSVTTWVEDYNRLYSDRSLTFTDAHGNTLANVRTMWVAIDFETRTAADLSGLDRSHFKLSERRSPVKRAAKQPPLGEDAKMVDYTFRYSDLDFNRHVNTVQYVKHILNLWSLEHYDAYEIGRFDIAFHKECLYGEKVQIRHADVAADTSHIEIIAPDGRHVTVSAISWRKRNNV